MFIVNSEHNSHHFLLFLLLNLNRKVFSGIASSHYNTISIQCIINFYIIDFFQIIKRCCQLYIQATQLLKNRHWNSFRVWLNNLVLLGCYSTHRDAAVIIYFVFYGQGGWRAYRDLVFQSEMEWTVCRDENYANAYVPETARLPPDNCPSDNFTPDNCPPKIATPENVPQIIIPWTIGTQTIAPRNNWLPICTPK